MGKSIAGSHEDGSRFVSIVTQMIVQKDGSILVTDQFRGFTFDKSKAEEGGIGTVNIMYGPDAEELLKELIGDEPGWKILRDDFPNPKHWHECWDKQEGEDG